MTKPKPIFDDQLPGRTKDQLIEEMIRVDHAGEYGAVRIYEGQLAVFGRRGSTQKVARVIRGMADQEQAHLETFDRLVNSRRIRPTLMAPVWHGAGFLLGAVTALMGEKTAMACTVAVEEAIDEHYGRQEQMLSQHDDPELTETIHSFRADEARHRRTALDHGAEAMPGYSLFSRAVKHACRLAIRISEKI